MKIRTPDYYDGFECIAGECPATCCAGWEIAIDPKSMKKYQSMEGALGNRMNNSINQKSTSFVQYDGKCSFLNEDHLCDLYQEAGEAYLCHTCRTYPRHTEYYGDEKELTLGISCPEVARIVLTMQKKAGWLDSEEQNKRSEAAETDSEFEQEFYDQLKICRAVTMNVLQMRELPIQERMGTAIAVAHNLQRRIRDDQLEELDELAKRYSNHQVVLRMAEKVRGYRCRESERKKIMRKMMKITSKLVVLNPEWSNSVKLARKYQKQLSDEAYIEGFRQFQVEVMSEYKVMMEQLICYFVMNYYCTAVYDGEVYGKMKFSLFAVLVIQEVCYAQWLEQGQKLTQNDIITNVYRYAREVEHLNENLDLLDRIFAKKRELCLEEFLIAVI